MQKPYDWLLYTGQKVNLNVGWLADGLITVVSIILPVLLAASVFKYLTSVLPTRGTRYFRICEALRDHRRFVLLLFLWAAFVLWDIPFLLSSYYDKVSEWAFWLQTASGNWPGPIASQNSFWNAFAAVLAILLNNSLYLFTIGVIWQLTIRTRALVTTLKQALTIRDEATKDYLTDLFSKAVPSPANSTPEELTIELDKAFKSIDAGWKLKLECTIGPQKTAQVFEALNRNL